MAIKRAKVQWILGFLFVVLLLVLAAWFEFHYGPHLVPGKQTFKFN